MRKKKFPPARFYSLMRLASAMRPTAEARRVRPARPRAGRPRRTVSVTLLDVAFSRPAETWQ